MAQPDNNITRLREILRSENATWRAGPTSMSALPHAERIKRLGVQPGPDDPPFAELVRRAESRKGAPIPRAASVGAPASFDLRNAAGKSYVWPIRDQGSCGACVAFASVAAMEG